MEKNRQRAIRRYHYDRLKEKRKFYYKYYNEDPWSEEKRGTLVSTSTPCSCWMCGNPRRYFKSVTRKEKINYEYYRQECERFGISYTLKHKFIRKCK